jgi:RNA polymerase sigma-70 factor (ECF subfamily)
MKLMRRFRDRDPDAVRELYESYGRAVFTIAYRALSDRGLAEEAVQLTFLQAWRAADRFDPEKEAGPWIYAIARRVAVDLYRRERRHQTVDHDEPEVAILPPSFEGAWEREILRATHYLGLTHEETASRLGIPVGTVKSRSYRAHRRMADLLSHLREATA